MDSAQNKPHRSTSRKSAKDRMKASGSNPKAFAVSAPGKMLKGIQRSADVTEKKYHVPMVNRLPDDEEPPVIVGVVGPSGVGKSTLVKSLVKRFTKTSISEIKGPITMVSGKRRRITVIEVKPDLNSMTDAAKIVDLVLLMIDGNYGLEMETFEFLNLAQHHGMPKVIGCVTHCDLFKTQSALRAQKKLLKHRFWTEVYKGAKLFYLSGVINGRYPDREILNLSRFISVMKFRPLKWRNDHPYLLVDRITDLTPPQDIAANTKIDRKIAVYGYVHGSNLKEDSTVHIAGLGDYKLSKVEKLPDPVPTPYMEQKITEYEIEQAKIATANGEAVAPRKHRRKRLEEKQKIIYAPMSDVGGVLIDKDAVYIDVGMKHHGEGKLVDDSKDKELETKLIGELVAKKSNDDTTEQKSSGFGLQLFEGGEVLHGADNSDKEEDNEEVDDDEDLLSDFEGELSEDENERGNIGRSSLRKINKLRSSKPENGTDQFELQEDTEFNLSDDEDDKFSDWRATGAKLQGVLGKKRYDINKLLYDDEVSPEEAIEKWKGEFSEEEPESQDEDDEEDFFAKKETVMVEDNIDRSKPSFASVDELTKKWDMAEENFAKLKKKYFFLSPRERLKQVDGEESEEESDEDNQKVTEKDDDFADFDAEESKGDYDAPEESDEQKLSVQERRSRLAKKKEQLRLQFEAEDDEFGGKYKEKEELNEYESWYEFQKAKMSKQLEINKLELEKIDEETRIKMDGYKAGTYVKITFHSLPCEFMENFDPCYPVILGGLLSTEMDFGMLSVRVRKHRWHKKILKSNDPIILSLGWRRFQTLPIYTTSDSRTRTRMLKYTPEHAYCQATFYGPLVTPNTTFCASQVVADSDTGTGFRIAASGVVEEVNSSVEIVKKLKLVGYPYKIFKNTAFIKDMFSTAMEVVKFEGAAIKTVSGIRGEIKRALTSSEGHYRATFEDRVVLSDIVFLKTWYPVKPKKFYNPVTSLALKDKNEWKGMRITGRIRAEKGLMTPANANSAYGKIERKKVKFNPLHVPKAVQSDLPFKSQISQMKPQKKKTYLQKRAVILNGEEKKTRTLVQQLNTLKKEKDSKKRAKKDEKNQVRIKKLQKAEKEKAEKVRERKKEYFAKNGKRGMSQEGGGGKRARN
ncbi:GTPase [Saccharomycopsis crataegensis]|uniref:GTPase n=1 Tax=Saccharomycopsis crataegensis TaxID=43959 RepID=A0AAV5QIE6_9ASCO|nr:GTPase [Saccharomycopsis crataegensis]